MKPISGSAPAYQPPVPDVEPPVAQATLGDPVQPRSILHAATSGQSSQPPGLGDVRQYPAGRYEHLTQAIINMKVDDQAHDEGKNRKGSRQREAGEGSRTAAAGRSGAASSSGQASGADDNRFMAEDLAELASWSENTCSFRAQPAHMFGRGAKLPTGTVNNMLEKAKKELDVGLARDGITLKDVVTAEGRGRVDINLNYLERKQYLPSSGFWGAVDANDVHRKLLSKADLYFDEVRTQGVPALPPLGPLKSKDSLGVMRELLRDSPGLILAESHRSESSKRVLIKNMKALKAAGVTTIFMEHLCEDSHGKALDAYIRSPKDSPMPARLRAYLDMQTRGNRAPDQPASKHSFTAVLEAAKQAGMRVIALDTAQTYATSTASDDSRIKVMNYYAAEKIRLSKPEGKWVAFVGSAHATTYEGIPGLAQLSGVRSLIVDDSGVKSRPQIATNVKNYLGKIDPDVTLSYKV